MQVRKLVRSVESSRLEAQEIFTKILKEFSVLDEKGEFVPEEGKPGTYQLLPEKGPELEAKVKEFDEMEFKVEIPKLKLGDIEGVALSPSEIDALLPILEE